MSEYFLKSKPLGANVKVKLDLPNYATKAGVDTSDFTKKTNLTNFESDKSG